MPIGVRGVDRAFVSILFVATIFSLDTTPSFAQQRGPLPRCLDSADAGRIEATLTELTRLKKEQPRSAELMYNIAECLDLHGGNGAGVIEHLKAAYWLLRKSSRQKPALDIQLVYSTEKRDFITNAIDEFRKRPEYKGIVVTTKLMGSVEAARKIAKEELKPDIWSPADHAELEVVGELRAKGGMPALDLGSSKRTLVKSPLVFLTSSDRARFFQDAKGRFNWAFAEQRAGKPWKTFGGSEGWGNRGVVTIGHTDPNASNSGLQVLGLFLHEKARAQGQSPLNHLMLTSSGFADALEGFERQVDHCEQSTLPLLERMTRYVHSPYDGVFVYENLAEDCLTKQKLGGVYAGQRELVMVALPITFVSDHPIVAIDWSKDKGEEHPAKERRQAAKKLIDFLTSPEIQGTARKFGFRPGGEGREEQAQQVIESMNSDEARMLRQLRSADACVWK